MLHPLSERTLDTSGAGHEEAQDGFGFGHQQVRGDVERHIEGKAVCRIHEKVFDASELIKKAHAAQAKGTRVDRDQRQSVLMQERAARGDREAGAISMYSIYKTNLSLRISIFFKDLASVDVGHIKIIDMKACCGTCSRWSVTVANKLLRVHCRGRCFT